MGISAGTIFGGARMLFVSFHHINKMYRKMFGCTTKPGWRSRHRNSLTRQRVHLHRSACLRRLVRPLCHLWVYSHAWWWEIRWGPYLNVPFQPPRPFVHPMNIVRPAMMAPISGGVFFPPNIIPPAMAAAAAAGGGAIPPPITTAMIPQPSLPQPISATNTNGSAVPPPLRTIKQQPEDWREVRRVIWSTLCLFFFNLCIRM